MGGAMLAEHSELGVSREGGLRVFCFASPPVISRALMDAQIGRDCVTTVALSTDFITRLSIESVLQFNARADLLLGMGDDIDIDDVDEGVLSELKNVQTPNPQKRLFPVGRVLWFVPTAAMEENEQKRVTALMRKENSNEKKKEMEDDTKEDGDEMEIATEEKTDVKNSKRCALMAALSVRSKGMERKENPEKVSKREKAIAEYGPQQYVLCDATQSKHVFQDFVVDSPESLLAHMPGRYLWAVGTSMTYTQQPDQ